MPRIRGSLDRGPEDRVRALGRRRRLGQPLYDDGLFGGGPDRPRDRQVPGRWRALSRLETSLVVGRRTDRPRRGRGRVPRPSLDHRLGAVPDRHDRPAGAGRRSGADLDDDALDLAGQPRDRVQRGARLCRDARRQGGRRQPRTARRNLAGRGIARRRGRRPRRHRGVFGAGGAFPAPRSPAPSRVIRLPARATNSACRSWRRALSKPTRGRVSST